MIAGVSLLLSALRFIMYFENKNLFTGFTFTDILFVIQKGFIYDISTALYLNVVFIFLFFFQFTYYNSRIYQFLLKLSFVLSNTVTLIINIVDISIYKHLHHRLTIFDAKSKLLQFWNNFVSADWQIFFKDYLILAIYFAAFFIVLILLSGFIKTINVENKSNRIVYRGSSLLFTILITTFFINNVLYKNTDLYKNMHLKADRKLTAVLVNNPYMIMAGYFAEERELSLDESWYLTGYNAVNKYNTNSRKKRFNNIKLIINQGKTKFKGKKYNTDLSIINTGYDNIFQILDELLFSFPSVFRGGLYKSLYSLNNMQSLVDILQSEGYYTQLKTYGYSDDTTDLIRNFYSFNNRAGTDRSKIFELILIKDNNAANDIISNMANNKNTKGNSLIISIVEANKKADVLSNKIEKNIRFSTDYKLSFRKNSKQMFTQYMDIKPCILHLTAYSKQFISYGNTLFANNEGYKYCILSDSSYYASSDSLLLHVTKNKTLGLYKRHNNRFYDYNFADSLVVERTAIESKLQSMLYDFRKRVVDNNLRVE